MASSSLAQVQARLVEVEIETETGSNWYENWLSMLSAFQQPPPPEYRDQLMALAKRMDAVIQQTSSSSFSVKPVDAVVVVSKDVVVTPVQEPLHTPEVITPPPVVNHTPNVQETTTPVAGSGSVKVNKPVKPSPPKAAVSPPKPPVVSKVPPPKSPTSPSIVKPLTTPPSKIVSASLPSPADAVMVAPEATIASPAVQPTIVFSPVAKPSIVSPVAKPTIVSPVVKSTPPTPAAAVVEKPTIPSNMSENLKISPSCFELFNDLKLRKKHQFLIFRINPDENVLELETKGEKSAPLEAFLDALPYAECRFAVVDYEWLKVDQYGSRMASKAFFVSWTPDPASTQHKMWYSTERKEVLCVFKGVEQILANNKNDILVGTGKKDKNAKQENSDEEEEEQQDDWMD